MAQPRAGGARGRRSHGEGKAEVDKGHAVDRPLTTQRLRPRRPRCRDAGRGREPRLDWAREHDTGRHGKTLSLYRLAFDNVVSDLLKVKPADTCERAGHKAETRPNKARKGSRRKG